MTATPLALLGFLNMNFIDILDILLVAVIIFILFRWIKGSSAMRIFLAILFLYIIRVIVSALNMRMMNALMETVLDVGVLALIVIFQPEVRRFLNNLGSGYRGGTHRDGFIARLFARKGGSLLSVSSAREVTEACRRMSESRTGALIVLLRGNSLEDIVETGDRIDALVSRRLIMNIFFKNSPLHDGAMIIGGDRIVAARCTLPMTAKTDIPASFGMRHKAAIGITEVSDAAVVLVSEETGHIAFVRNGEVTITGNINELKLKIDESMAGAQDVRDGADAEPGRNTEK